MMLCCKINQQLDVPMGRGNLDKLSETACLRGTTAQLAAVKKLHGRCDSVSC